MSLNCDFDYEPEPGDVCWHEATKWTQHNRKRSPKCCSCGEIVPAEKNCLRFPRFKIPKHDVELAIYGEDGEIARAPWWMCWECGWKYLALSQHGYAINIRENMAHLLIEHDELTATGNAGCL